MTISPMPLPERIEDEPTMLRYLDTLLANEASSNRNLWVFLLDVSGRPLHVATCIDDVPTSPDPRVTGNLFLLVQQTLAELAPGGSVAMALERPGTRQLDRSDREWGYALRWGARGKGVQLRGPYLVAAGQVRRLPDGDAN